MIKYLLIFLLSCSLNGQELGDSLVGRSIGQKEVQVGFRKNWKINEITLKNPSSIYLTWSEPYKLWRTYRIRTKGYIVHIGEMTDKLRWIGLRFVGKDAFCFIDPKKYSHPIYVRVDSYDYLGRINRNSQIRLIKIK